MSCNQCDLHKQCKNVLQMGNGKKSARIMVVQESPYEMENKKKEYMGGKAGRMFRAALGEVGIDIDDVYFTSVVKCSTPDDRLPLPDEIRACQDYLMAEIDIVQPEVVIPTGNISMKALMNKTGITKHRGKMVEIDNIKYMPLIHPNMVLKQPKYLDMFSEDMVNLESILNGTVVETRSSYKKERNYCETYEDAISEIRRLMELPDGHKVVVDLETIKTNPFISSVTMGNKSRENYPDSGRPKIVAIGFSDRSGYGSSIPLYHRETPFTGNQIGTIIKFLRWLFESTNLEFAAHNGKFDIKWLRSWLDIEVDNMIWDTMLIHYLCISEEKGTHGLKDLAWLETDMGGYDDELDKMKPKGEDEGNYDLISWDILKVYLADDCDVTYRLLDKWIPLVEDDEEKKWLWHNLMVPGYYTLMDIECNGIFVNREWLDTLIEEYPKEIKRIEGKLRQYPEVIEMEREFEQLWQERVEIGAIQRRDRTDEQQSKFEKYKKYDPSKGGTTFSFTSPIQLKELLFNRIGLKTPILTDKGEEIKRSGGELEIKHYSTNEDSLKIIAKQHPIAELLMELKKVVHLNNNFVAGMLLHLDDKSIIHPSYNIHGTVTGRLSSNEPKKIGHRCGNIAC